MTTNGTIAKPDATATAKQSALVLGCLATFWQMFVLGPIWLTLQFGVLRALGDRAPEWIWVLYWVYVPATLVGMIIVGLAKTIAHGLEK